jgi:hypothetical protein
MACFLLDSLRCCRKVKGFSSGHCCEAKLLFHIDTWHSGEQVSELFWTSVSSSEEWGIWSRLNYFLPLWDGWSDISDSYLSTIFFFWFSNVGELNQGFAYARQTFSHWATFLAPIFFLSLAVLDWNSGLYACKLALYCLSYIISPF